MTANIRGCIDCRRIDVDPDINHRCMDCAAKVPQMWAPPSYIWEDLRYRLLDLRSVIAAEDSLGRNSALLRAARRAARSMNDLIDTSTIHSSARSE